MSVLIIVALAWAGSAAAFLVLFALAARRDDLADFDGDPVEVINARLDAVPDFVHFALWGAEMQR